MALRFDKVVLAFRPGASRQADALSESTHEVSSFPIGANSHLTARIALIASKLAVTGALLWFALRNIDASSIGAQVSAAQPIVFSLAVLLLALQPALGAARWYLIMNRFGAPILKRQSIRLTYVSAFLNQVLPGGVGGDAIRTWLAFREGHQLSHALNGVAMDRLLGFGTLVLLALTSVAMLDHYSELRLLELSLIPLAAALVAGVALLMLLDRLPKPLARFRAIRALGYLARDARALFLSGASAAVVLALSVIANVNLCASLFLFMVAFNTPLAAPLLAISAAPVILASSLPISVGGWGTREAAVVAMMAILSVNPEPAVVASISFGLAGLLITLPGAWLMYRSGRVR